MNASGHHMRRQMICVTDWDGTVQAGVEVYERNMHMRRGHIYG